MSDTKSPTEIEREIERERAELTDTIETIQDRFSPEELVRQVSREFRNHSGDIGRAVTRSVKENPVGLALTGVGLAWMIFGRSNSSYAQTSYSNQHGAPQRRFAHTSVDRDDYAESRDTVEDYWHDDTATGPALDTRPARRLHRTGHPDGESTGRHRASWTVRDVDADWDDQDFDDLYEDEDDEAKGRSFKARVEAARRKMAERRAAMQSTLSDGVDAARSSAEGAASGVAGAASSAASSVSSAASSAAEGVGDAASATGDAVSSAASNAASALGSAYSRIAEGTENMGEAARERVIAARERAIIGKEKAKRGLRKGANDAADFFEEQPLVAGAIALAVGAAIGGAMPRTRIEDENVGAHSDRLFREAERVFQEEKQRLTNVAKAATEEAKDIAEDARAEADARTPGDEPAEHSLADAAREAGRRIEGTVRSEAAKQNVGGAAKSAVTTDTSKSA